MIYNEAIDKAAQLAIVQTTNRGRERPHRENDNEKHIYKVPAGN